jgi:hypothetical protein
VWAIAKAHSTAKVRAWKKQNRAQGWEIRAPLSRTLTNTVLLRKRAAFPRASRPAAAPPERVRGKSQGRRIRVFQVYVLLPRAPRRQRRLPHRLTSPLPCLQGGKA